MPFSFFKKDTITKFYRIEKTLGTGSFATVKKAINKATEREYAVKIVDRSNLEAEDEAALQTEVEILQRVDHPHVVSLHEIFDEKSKLYMVMELMTGGELFDRIVAKEHYSEKEAADTIRPVVEAIQYCHRMGIVHRDLKPENLLYDSPDSDAKIKISDFGLARLVTDDEMMKTACGTPGYVAPEILKQQGYSEAVDFWSIGVILYVLLCGFPPFYDENNAALYEKIKSGSYDFPSPYWDGISELAKDLIRRLLVVDPAKRANAEEILSHVWICGEDTPRTPLDSARAQLRQMQQISGTNKFRQAAHAVMASNMMSHAIGSTRRTSDS
eukprot:GILK01000315.1.p1 GENE.GILK01000315.1~~GILK01000315.1.p1  ORF type:complete len:356 (-),score=65.20 GILK01000315.1:193-1176(-)